MQVGQGGRIGLTAGAGGADEGPAKGGGGGDVKKEA